MIAARPMALFLSLRKRAVRYELMECPSLVDSRIPSLHRSHWVQIINISFTVIWRQTR